jgi:hypothetical protein
VFPRFKKITQFSPSFLGLKHLLSLSFLCSVVPLQTRASSLFLYNAHDTLSTPLPQAHLLNLSGNTSLSAHLNLRSKNNSPDGDRSFAESYDASGVFTFTQNSQILIHGFYLSPSFFRNSAQNQENIAYLATSGWAISIGRANISYPQSTYRGFIQITYRQTKVDPHDEKNQTIVTDFELPSAYQERKSFLLSLGASTTHTDLVSQKKPLLDSEILISLRYDYEKGDFFSKLQGSFFYPTFVDLGATASWYKIFNEPVRGENSNVTDAFQMGPRVRARFLKNHLALDSSFLWPLYRSFDGKALFTSPRFDLCLVTSF